MYQLRHLFCSPYTETSHLRRAHVWKTGKGREEEEEDEDERDKCNSN